MFLPTNVERFTAETSMIHSCRSSVLRQHNERCKQVGLLKDVTTYFWSRAIPILKISCEDTYIEIFSGNERLHDPRHPCDSHGTLSTTLYVSFRKKQEEMAVISSGSHQRSAYAPRSDLLSLIPPNQWKSRRKRRFSQSNIKYSPPPLPCSWCFLGGNEQSYEMMQMNGESETTHSWVEFLRYPIFFRFCGLKFVAKAKRTSFKSKLNMANTIVRWEINKILCHHSPRHPSEAWESSFAVEICGDPNPNL